MTTTPVFVVALPGAAAAAAGQQQQQRQQQQGTTERGEGAAHHRCVCVCVSARFPDVFDDARDRSLSRLAVQSFFFEISKRPHVSDDTPRVEPRTRIEVGPPALSGGVMKPER